MASRFRNLFEKEVQDALSRVPTSPENPQANIGKAQTLARSNNPQAARAGQSMLADAARDQEQAAREQERAAKQAETEAKRVAAEQAAQAEAMRKRDVRAQAAQGAVTETDIETGKRTIATHPDGAPKFKAGPLGEPEQVGSQSTAVKDAVTGQVQSAPASNPMIPGDGALGAAGGTTQAVFKQPVRDDRGNVSLVDPATTTDAKTGRQVYSSTDPTTGQTVKQAVGIDQAVQEQARKDADIERRTVEIATRENAVATARMQFEPRWTPTKREFDEAGTVWNKFNEDPKFIMDPKTGKMAKRDPATGLPAKDQYGMPVAYDPNELVKWQKDRNDAQSRYLTAKQAHDKLEPTAENLNRNETEIKTEKLRVGRMKLGLPEDDAGIAETLGLAAGEIQPSREQEILNAFVGPPAPDAVPPTTVSGPTQPLIPADNPDQAAIFTRAFSGLADPSQFKIGATGDGYAFIQRGNGGHVGFVEIDRKTGKSLVVLNDNTGHNADIRQLVAFGATTGQPVYMRDAGKRDLAAESQYVASVFQVRDDPAIQDPAAKEAILRDMEATPQAIAARVNRGELSVQNGELLVKELYGSTLKATDPMDKKTLAKWLEESPVETKKKWAEINRTKDTEGRNGMMREFISDWFVENRWKPGVNFQSRQLAEKGMIFDKRTGEKAAALGGILVEAGGSMIGMLSAPLMIGGLTVMSGLQGGTDEAYDTALADTYSNYGRASKNTWRGWNMSLQKWGTPEGKARLSALELAQRDLRAQINSQDVYVEGINDPKFKAAYKQTIDKVTDAAFAMHEMNLEEGWEITREDLDPSTNPQLAKLVNGYALTGDSTLLDSYFTALMEDHGTRQAQTYIAELTEGRGKFMSGIIAGANAPPEEIGIEMLSTALTAGTGWLVFGGAKAAAKTGTAAASAGRMAKFRAYAHGIKDEALAMGMVTNTLAKPANLAGRVSNNIVGGVKVAGVNAITEAGEEGAMGFADPNATSASITEAAAVGALAGFFMGPVMGIPTALAANSRAEYDRNQSAAKFAVQYNKASSGTEGFVPLTTQQARTAMALVPPGLRDALVTERDAATAGLIQAVQAAKDSTDPVVLSALTRAQVRSLIANDNLAAEAAIRAEAVQAIQSLDPAERDFGAAVAKVAGMRPDLLTSAERSAAGGATTADGKPFFASVNGQDVITDAGRAEALNRFPAIGALIQTTESQAIFDASTQTPATNEQDPQGTPGQQAPAEAAQPAPADPNTPVPGGGNGTPAPVSGGTGAPAAQAPVSGNSAAMDAAEYTALRAQDPSLPDIPAVVAAARAAGQPVSPSMEKAAGTPPPGGQTASGSGQTVSEAAAVADQVKANVEARFPSIKGRISIVPQSLETGGADIVIETGEIRLSVGDIERAIKRAGGDIAKATAILESIVARHEVVHVVQTQALRPMWEAAGKPGTFESYFLDYYSALAPELLTKKAVEAARQIYGKDGWDRIPTDAQKAAEFVRMLVEAKLDPKKTGEFSELFRAIENRGAKAKITELIKAAVVMLRKMKLTGAAAEHVAKVEELYKELTAEAQKKPEIAENPAKSPKNGQSDTKVADPTGFRIETKGDAAEVLDGNTVLWRGPASEAQAELESLQAAQSSPMRITGEAIKAALVKFPRLSGKLRGELEAAADEIMDELDALPAGERMAAAEKAIADRIDRIADREAERTGKNRMEVIEGFRAVAGKRASQQAASIEQAVIGSEAPQVPAGKQESRPTPNGEMTVDVTSTFVDLDQLVGSSDPLFPGGALQPRNRSTQASQNQREEMVQNLRDKPDQARRYIEGVTTDAGRMIIAPLFAADGTHMTNDAGKPLFYVLSGNGRRNALKEAANRNVSGPVMKGFREASAAEGIDTENMTLPVPVAVFVPQSAKEAIDLAEYSNRDAQLSVSNTEQANRDAASIEKANILKLWEPDASGDPAAASNRDFVKAFARAVGDEGILDTRGELTDEGAKRIERAMVAMLLGPDQGLVLDSLFNRSGTLGLRAILGGVASETGSLLKLAGAKPDFDLSPVLASALKTAVEAKQAVANGQFRDVSEFFDQGSLFESTDNTPERQLARAIVESRSRKAVREILAAYRKGADAVDTSTMSMFAEEETTRESLILKALEARPVEQVVAEIEAEFGKSSDLAAKLRVGVPAIKKLDAGQRREFMAGVNAEVDRLRAGVMSAEEWQRLNPDALGAKEALFQRFLDSHTAETIAGGFNRLLSPKVQGVLGSSEETSAPREHLGIPRTDMPQIRIDVRGKFRRWMEAEGIRVSIEEINPNTLTPSQADLWDTAIKGAHKHTRTRNVIVSADGYILDGHHQWKAAQEKGKTKLPVVVIGLPAREALAKMHEFGKVDHSALPGTRYENEEYMYGGKAPEDWRKSNLPEASIVNPINPDLSPDAKTEALIDLASQNVPLVEQILANLRSNVGVEGKYSIKLPERIQGKASRPSIRDEAPWHDIEHVRDGLRFKVTLTHFNQIEGIVQEFANAGIEIIKFDTKKMFAPKEFGWRFIGFDMRMPNGQLVEFYAPLGTMDQKSVKEPNHLLFEKWRNVPKHVWLNDPALAAERAADVRESRDRYDAAFMEGIEAMGLTYAEAEALFNNLVSAAESVISSQSDMGPLRAPSVQMSGLESRQTDSPARMMSARPSPGNRSFDPRAEAYAKGLVEGFEVEDTADKDGEITTTNTKFGSGNQGNSGSSLGSSADSGFDLFGEIEPSILGPRAKVKRNALAAIKAQPAGSTAQTNIAKQIGKREGMADLDLFAAASVRSLDAKPKKSESVPDDSDQGQSGNPLNPRLYGGQPTKGTRGTRGVGADQDLFDFSGRPSGATGNQDGGPASPDVQGTQAGVSGSGDGSAATSSDIGGRGPGTGRPAGSNEGVRPDSGNAGKRRLSERQRPPLNSPERNFTIGKNTVLAEGGAITRLRNNLAAIDILRQLEKEGRNATVEEKAAMAKYVGWGGIPQVFDEGKARAIADGEIETRRETAERYKRNYPGRYTEEIERQETRANDLEKWQEKWGEHYTRLESLLTPEEWESARDSTINAHYTSPTVINGMWDAVKRFGFEGGNVLEPAGGVGHYFGLMPPSMVGKSRLFGVELDSISGRIFGKLYPEADIEVTGFQDSTLPENSQDLVISNVPFANITVSDAFLDAQPGAPKFNLHNYFFEKALRMTRPGGIVAFITTANTMDSQITQRKWLAERADFLGAIRLPNDAFKANANTQVVTDIIFLRKPDGSPNPMAEEQWSSTRTVGLEGGGSIEVNEYFARHPEMILGRLADDGSMYGGRKEMTVHSTGDLAEQLRAAVDRLPENVVGEGQADAIERLSTANRGAKDGAFIEEDGKIRIKGDNDPVPVKELGKVRAFMNLRDTLNDLYDMESDPGATDAQIAAQRSALNRAYDGFKSVYKILHDPKNKRLLETDPDFYRTLGLEVPVGEKKILRQQEFRKADVFSKRVLEPRVAPESAENIDDALIHSFRWKGRLDARYIGKLLGITVDEAETRLLGTEHAYRDPSTGKVEHATNYLAGNVRKKLRDAEFAAQKDPSMRRNVEGLRAALPEDVGWADINFKMGSSWIPAEMYERFLSEKLFDGRRKATVIYNKGVGDLITDSFMVQQDSTGYPSAIDTQWGTRRKSATEIAEALLNQRDPRVTKTVDGKPVYDAEATDMARAAASRMADAFQEWVAANTEVQESLHRIYNESFNSHVIPKYDGSFMQLPWVASDFDLYSEKKHVVWRALQEGTLLVAHGVGGGKTIIGTAIAMETRRLGLAKKPLIVVHNATLEQFATTITQMAPTARVLVARKEDLAGPKRKEFMGRVRSGDWDAVIMAHSTFDLIPDDPAWERQQINDLIGELEDAIREQGGDPAQNDLKKIKDPSVKELVKMRTRLKDRMSKLQERRVDDVLNFQELGIDAMIVDEVHRYKKQPFVTRQSNIAGIDTSFSKRGSAMQLRAKWVQAINQGRGVFTMTGTPVTNTLGESWNMVRLVRPDLLKEFGVQTFDRFVSVFGNIKQSGELRPNGRYKPVTRLSEFTNIPEWNRFWGLAADVKMGDDMQVKGRPRIKGGKPSLTAVPRTAQVKAIIDEISKVIDAYDQMTGKEKHENQHVPLLTYAAARMAAIDVRLINPEAKDEEGSKVNTALKNVMRLYNQTTANKGTQVIFSDSYRPLRTTRLDLSAAEFEQAVGDNSDTNTDEDADDGGFNLYHDMREKLVKAGVPRSEIAIISEMKNDKQREALFARVNSGEVRIIMGSTETLGTGVNMQQRMIAAHHLDVPWTPAGLEQRDGRVYRQGNMWAEMGDGEIEIMRYGMKDTLDAALWQKLETKERMIKQAVSGKVNARVIEDDAGLLNYMEQKAALSGADGMLKFELDEKVRQLKNDFRANRNRQFDLQRATTRANETIANADNELPSFRAIAKNLAPMVGVDPAEVEWTFAGGEAVKGEDARKALDVIFKERRKKAGAIMNPEKAESIRVPIEATANGVRVVIEVVDVSEDLANVANPDLRWNITWHPHYNTGKSGYGFSPSPHPGSVINQMPSRAENLAIVPESLERSKAQAEKDLVTFADEMAKPFTKQDDFGKALVDQAVLYNRMGMGYPESPDIYQSGIGDNWETVLDAEVKASQATGTAPRGETPGNYPGRGLAPAMASLGSSSERLDGAGNTEGIDTNSPGGANIGDGAQPGNSAVTLYRGINPDASRTMEFGEDGIHYTSDKSYASTFGEVQEVNALLGRNLNLMNIESKADFIRRFELSGIEKESVVGIFVDGPATVSDIANTWENEGPEYLMGEDFTNFLGRFVRDRVDSVTFPENAVEEDPAFIILRKELVGPPFNQSTPADSGASLRSSAEESSVLQTAANIIALAKELDPEAFKAAMEDVKAYIKRRKDEGIPLGPVLEGDQVTLAAQGVLVKYSDNPRALAMLDGYGEDQFSRLRSSAEESSAVQEALAKMPPMYRKVFEDIEAGDSPSVVMKRHGISEKAVTNILNQVRARIAVATAAAGDTLKPAMKDGLIDGGRPDLALSTNPTIAAVDQTRNESDVPDVRGWAEVNAQAAAMLEKDYAGTYDMLLAKARDLQPMTDMETAAAKMIIAKETLAGRIQTPAERVKIAMMIHGYRDIGTETARSLAIRRDPHQSPAERHAQFIAEALFTPDAETRKAMREAKKGQVQDILAGWMSRVDAIKSELLAQGIDLDASLAEFNERQEALKATQAESPRAAKVIEEQIRKLTKHEKMVIEAIRSGALLDKIEALTGLDADTILDINARFNAKIREAMVASAKRFLAGSLGSSPVDMMTQILAELGVWGNDVIDNRKPEFVDRRKEILNPKPRKETPQPKPAAPAPVPLTPEQQAAINAAFERFKAADPSTWSTLWQTEAKTLVPLIGQVGFEAFKGKSLQPWRDRWQTEMDGVANPSARITFDEWIAKPSTKETAKREREMFPAPINETTGTFDTTAANRESTLFPQPINEETGTWNDTRPYTAQGELLREEINETTGTFDLNDPVVMMEIANAFAVARATPGEKIMEFWKMSILSGPQTHIVNVSSNTLFSAYNLLPRRAAEAGTNTLLSLVGLGSQESATFGEFSVMARHLRQAVTLAARLGLSSWKAETRTFEAYASAEPLQLDFTGVGGEKFAPALGGKLGKVMRSISFRAMTAADEFGKSFFAQLEAAAQAHRIARVEEKLRGPAYEARLKELLVPGSIAWIRAIDEAKRITFQTDIDGTRPQLINRIDQLAELAKKGRAMPWIGKPLSFFLPFIDTPTNIAKQAAIMSPLGAFLAVVDGTRALKRKIMRGNLTKQQADAEAAELYNRARLVQDVTNQSIALMLYLAIDSLTEGDDDDEAPRLTGSMEYRSSKQGERDNAYAVMPPQSIRIFGTILSYKRFEPFATVITAIADLSRESRRAGGILEPGVGSKWLASFKDQMAEKTFLQGVSNLMDAFENPERFGSKLTGNIVTGFIPNIIRQPIRTMDTTLRESRPRADQGFFESIARSVGHSIAPQAAPMKIDVWGRPIQRNRGQLIGNRATDSLIRIFDPTNVTVNPDVDPIDLWIYRYNLATADSKQRIGIQPIANSLQFTVPGEKERRKIALTVEEQAEANRRAGQNARRVLGDDWKSAELSAANAERIAMTVQQAQNAERARLRMEKFNAGLPPLK